MVSRGTYIAATHVHKSSACFMPADIMAYTLRAAKFEEHQIDRSLSKKKQQYQRRKLKSLTQIAANIEEHAVRGITVRCPDLTKTLRYKLRQTLPACWEEGGYFMESRGLSERERCLYVWRARDVSSVLKNALPHDVVDQIILPRLFAISRAESMSIQRAKEEKVARDTRVYSCDGCGCQSTADNILVSVHHSGKFCELCIDDDEDMRGSKWEDALPYFKTAW